MPTSPASVPKTAFQYTTLTSPPDQAVIDWDSTAVHDPERVDPAPEFEFDQTVSW